MWLEWLARLDEALRDLAAMAPAGGAQEPLGAPRDVLPAASARTPAGRAT